MKSKSKLQSHFGLKLKVMERGQVMRILNQRQVMSLLAMIQSFCHLELVQKVSFWYFVRNFGCFSLIQRFPVPHAKKRKKLPSRVQFVGFCEFFLVDCQVF